MDFLGISQNKKNMSKLTMEIKRFFSQQKKGILEQTPNKVGNWENRRDNKEERAYFWIAPSCLWKRLETWLTTEDWTQQSKIEF